MPSPGLSELITVTHRHRSPEMVDNVLNNIGLLNKLKEKNRIKMVSGGRTLVSPHTYQENTTYKRYSGYEQLDVSPTDTMTAAEYAWKQIAGAISFSGLEVDVQNSGKEQIFDLIEERWENLESTFQNNMSVDVYSDGTADGGKQIDGLQAKIADNPQTGIVGGIDRATHPYWRNFSFNAATDGGAVTSAANIERFYDEIAVNTIRGNDSFDLITVDNNHFNAYRQTLRSRQRIVDANGKLAQAGFQVLKYGNADVCLDGGYGGACPANRSYFVNTKHLKLCVAKKRNMSLLTPDRQAVNQDATVRIMAWAGNITMSNGFTQGVLVG